MTDAPDQTPPPGHKPPPPHPPKDKTVKDKTVSDKTLSSSDKTYAFFPSMPFETKKQYMQFLNSQVKVLQAEINREKKAAKKAAERMKKSIEM